MDKGKISSIQLAFLLFPAVLGTAPLSLPAMAFEEAGVDFWMTGVIAAIGGVIMILTATGLHDRYPERTVIEYSAKAFGRIPARIVGLLYFLILLHSTGLISREYAEFVTGSFLVRTPALMVIALMLLLAALAVRGGVEVLARSAVIFTPIFIIPIFILFLLTPDMDPRNIFPIMSHGVVPVLKGSVFPLAMFSEFFLMTFFLPRLTDRKQGRKWGLLALGVVSVSVVSVFLMILFFLGTEIGDKVYPILTAFRYISVADFLENFDSLLLSLWVVGNFMKITVFYYVTVAAFAQSLSLRDYRPYVFPIGVLAILLSFWDLPDFPGLLSLLKGIYPYEITLITMLIPLLLLVASWFSEGKSSNREHSRTKPRL